VGLPQSRAGSRPRRLSNYGLCRDWRGSGSAEESTTVPKTSPMHVILKITSLVARPHVLNTGTKTESKAWGHIDDATLNSGGGDRFRRLVLLPPAFERGVRCCEGIQFSRRAGRMGQQATQRTASTGMSGRIPISCESRYKLSFELRRRHDAGVDNLLPLGVECLHL